MSPMSDQPLTLGDLAEFHRKVILPDMHRTFESLFERLVKPRFDQIDGRFDAVFHKLDKLETEYEALKAGLARVEERLDRMDERFGRVEVRLGSLESQYEELLAASNRLEERLRQVESRFDEAAAARERDPLRGEVADLRARVDVLQLQVRNLEKRFDR